MSDELPRRSHVQKIRREDRHMIRRAGCDRPAPERLLLGIGQFNRGEYWDCHETLEEIWMGEPDDVRYLYQGILLVAVGLLHLHRANHHGAITKLRSGLELLQRFEPCCMGVDVSGLMVASGRILEALSGGPEVLDIARSLPAPQCAHVAHDE